MAIEIEFGKMVNYTTLSSKLAIILCVATGISHKSNAKTREVSM